MCALPAALAGAYIGAAAITFYIVEGSLWNRIFSALLWPTFPLWGRP